MSVKDLIVGQLTKVILENKEEYLKLAEEEVLKLVKEIHVPSEKEPVVDVLLKELQEIFTSIGRCYAILQELVEEFGHPKLEAPKK